MNFPINAYPPCIQGEVLLRFIQSKEEQKKVLHACHVDPTAGHLGKSKTLYKIKERFMWHGVVKDVQDMVSSSILYLCFCFSYWNDSVSFNFIDLNLRCMPTNEQKNDHWCPRTTPHCSKVAVASAWN